MATVNPSPFGPKPQFELSSGVPAVGNKLFFYVAGSVGTKQTTFTSSTGLVANTNPVILDALGMPTTTELWFTAGQSYKVVYAPSTDTDPPTSPIWTIDNLLGINDTTSAQSEWVAGPAPTFVSATSFTLAGDQTSLLHVGRRLKTTNTSGTIYSTITASVFGAVTTVTVANDSGTLDSGLSAVSYGLLSSTNFSVPGLINIADLPIVSAAGTMRGASAPNEPVNLSLSASVAGSALTIAIKGRNGSDPSASNPVLIPFRNATAGTGDYSWLVLTAATSLAVSSGSTLGTFNAVASRVWVVAFNDAGTFRLGVINCLNSGVGGGSGRDVTAIFALSTMGIASSTAEGGAGAADSALTFYTGAAVTSKAYAVLGYITFESGQATAGTWATSPSRVQLKTAETPMPGQAVQVSRIEWPLVATGVTTVPQDNTIPQSNEGDLYMTSQLITPSSATNVLSVNALAMFSYSVATNVIMSLFQDSVANALKTSIVSNANVAGGLIISSVSHLMAAATTAATTFKIRAGGAGAGTTTFNGAGGTQTFGGVSNSFIEVTEIMS